MDARRRVIAKAVAMAALLLMPNLSARASVAEDSVKAAFLFRFASFVTWPANAFKDAQEPIRLCVVGSDVFSALLKSMAERPKIDGRAFEIRSLEQSGDASACHIVYATGATVEQTLRLVRSHPVLTVTDAAWDSTRGMIHFVIVQDRVRFHIDEAEAEQGGLSISSRLLSLAVSVRRKQ